MRLTSTSHLLTYSVAQIAATAGGMSDTSDWLGIYATTQAQLSLSLLLAAPVAAAIAAHASAMLRANGLNSLASGSSRRRWWVQLCASEALAISVAAYGVAYMLALAWSASYAQHGTPRLILFIADSAMLSAASSLGALLGSRLPRYIAAVVAFVAVYLLLGIGIVNFPRVLSSVTTLDDRWPAFMSELLLTAFFTAVWLLLVALALILFMARSHRTALTVAWLSSACAAALLFVGSADRSHDASAARLQCTQPTGSRLAICLPRVKSYLVQQIVAQQEPSASFPGTEHLILIDDEVSTSTEVQQAIDTIGSAGPVILLSQVCDISAYTQIVEEDWADCPW